MGLFRISLLLIIGMVVSVICNHNYYQVRVQRRNELQNVQPSNSFWYGRQKLLDWACSLCWQYPHYDCHPLCFGRSGYGPNINGYSNYGYIGNHHGYRNTGYRNYRHRNYGYGNYGYGNYGYRNHGYRRYRPSIYGKSSKGQHLINYKYPMKYTY